MMDRRKFFSEALFATSAIVVGSLPEIKEVEKTDWNGKHYKAIFVRADIANSNNRIYPKKVLANVLETLTEVIRNRGLMGELGQPQNPIIHFNNASHLITGLKWNNDCLEADIEVLQTPSGEILKELLSKTNLICFRPRGVGNGVVDNNGILTIGDSYKMITIDALQTEAASRL